MAHAHINLLFRWLEDEADLDVDAMDHILLLSDNGGLKTFKNHYFLLNHYSFVTSWRQNVSFLYSTRFKVGFL